MTKPITEALVEVQESSDNLLRVCRTIKHDNDAVYREFIVRELKLLAKELNRYSSRLYFPD